MQSHEHEVSSTIAREIQPHRHAQNNSPDRGTLKVAYNPYSMCQMGETGNITCLVSHGYQKLLPSQPRAADAHISYTANEAVMLDGLLGFCYDCRIDA